ncbi:MAG TPA: SigE family RNA polymerase sigma factor [Candidatus Luteococcus avicola]|nr:SigE family RNA polymerase sigma factor [Candidatus Luteococcus avicola]
MTRPDTDEEFIDFVERSSTRLLRYCHLLTGSSADADDPLQASLLKIYEHWGRINEPAAAERYCKQIITRTNITNWRRVGRREHPSDQLADRRVEAVDVGPRDEMWRALQGLGERQRTVLVLRFYEDLAEAESAEFMGTSLGTVKSQLHRGLANLRAELANQNMEGAAS